MVLDFGVTGIYHTLPEFMSLLYQGCRKVGKRINVNVYQERIRYNNSRKPGVFDEITFTYVLHIITRVTTATYSTLLELL